MRASTAARQLDWETVKGGLDLAQVATRLLGPAPGRRGEHGRVLWWRCPLGSHPDDNPSFRVEPGSSWWRCFGCGGSGDAMALVRILDPTLSFRQAVAILAGNPLASGRPRAPTAAPARQPAKPSGLPEAEALALVETAEARLWATEAAGELDRLRGRGLSDDTIRAARLGWTSRAEGVPWSPPGLILPWFDRGRLALVKVRPDDAWRSRFPREGRPPKYVEVFRCPAHLLCYPGAEVVRPGVPLVVTEGELDARLVAQELRDLAAVVTLGSASSRPTAPVLTALLPASTWYIAHDADEAGDVAGRAWPASARRVRPPGPFKDWTEAALGGVSLRRWWADRLAGVEVPALFSWSELETWRWGPAVGDPTPGIIID